LSRNSFDAPDPYLWLEDLEDPKVVEWASVRDERAREELRLVSEGLYPRVGKYYSIPMVIAVKASGAGVFTLSREEGAYKVKLIASDGGTRELRDSRELGANVLIKAVFADKDGARYAVSYSHGGSDKGYLDVVDAGTGDVLDRLDGVVGEITWINDEEYYYVRYYREGETPDGVEAPASRVFCRGHGREEMVFGEGIPTSYRIALKKSRDGARALLNVSYGWNRSSVHAGALEEPEGWERIYGGEDFMAVPIDHVDGEYFVTSYDGEGFGRIMAVSADGSGREVLGEHGCPLQEAVVADDRFVASYLEDASSTLRTYRLNGERLDEISFDALGSVDHLGADGDRCVFRYQSFMVPYRIYSLEDGGLNLMASEEVGGAFEVGERWATSKDGTRIHTFRVKRRGTEPTRALVYGYGGFAIPLTPRFFPHVIPFVEDGGVFVQANLRGGTEYGEGWHRAGMRDRKQNVFDDFVSVIEGLKGRGHAVVATGRSNGGLLVGSVMTQRPELLDGAVIGYPVLDMRRFHELYVGNAWSPEYGDPDDPDDAEYLAKYSPYHNVSEGAGYPPMLIYTGLHDDRVHPGHAFKFAAKLEEAGAGYLLRVERESGHAGATPETKIREDSDVMAFVYDALGMKTR
jgi:prolyl oligopeptidase